MLRGILGFLPLVLDLAGIFERYLKLSRWSSFRAECNILRKFHDTPHAVLKKQRLP